VPSTLARRGGGGKQKTKKSPDLNGENRQLVKAYYVCCAEKGGIKEKRSTSPVGGNREGGGDTHEAPVIIKTGLPPALEKKKAIAPSTTPKRMWGTRKEESPRPNEVRGGQKKGETNATKGRKSQPLKGKKKRGQEHTGHYRGGKVAKNKGQ